jgi:integrase
LEEENTMPSTQRGSVVKRGSRWAARYYDEQGKRQFRGGFETKSAARDWVEDKTDEVEKLRRGERPRPSEVPTVSTLVDSFLAAHQVDPATTEKLRQQLKHATSAFGDRPIDRLTPYELDAWRAGLPARSRHHYFRAFRQVLGQAVTWRLLERNPSDGIKNRRAVLDEDREIQPFADWAEVEAIAEELHPRYRAVPVVLVGTGLRPEELWGLERRHFDRVNGVLSVEQVYTQGRLKPCKKSDLQRRRVPLRRKVLEALNTIPPSIHGPLIPGHDGGYVRHQTFRLRHWTPALNAAGIERRGVYATRHTFAAWSIRAGIQLFYLSRIMGTSVEMISQTYGHLVPDSEEYLRGLLDTYDVSSVAELQSKGTQSFEKIP